ncbi:hypothetical protein [Bradyrhizobium sp. USDA 4454]
MDSGLSFFRRVPNDGGTDRRPRAAIGPPARVNVVRAFYAGEYVRAFRSVRAAPVGKALLMRLFG